MSTNISVRQHSNKMYGNETFFQILNKRNYLFESSKFFTTYDFVKSFANYIEERGFPCNKIAVDIYNGYTDKISLILYLNENKVCYALIESINKGQKLQIDRMSFYDKSDKIYATILREFFDNILIDDFQKQLSLCGISNPSKKVTLNLSFFKDFKKDGEITIEANNLDEAFDKYITANDRLKYINGSYYRFDDNNWNKLFSIWISLRKENPFLMNAVRRGLTID